MTNILHSIVFLAALLPCSTVLADITFTEGDLSNGSSTTAVGQAFSPGLEPSPDPMLSAGNVVNLDSVLFSSGGGGTGAVNTRLAIMAGAFYDFNGDPNGSFVPTTSDAVAVSDNTINTNALAYGDAIEFIFSGAEVNYQDVYSAVFVTINGANELTPVAVSTAFIEFTETSPGVFEPVSNYGGTGNFNATALFADSNGDGFFEGSSDATDLSFTASFSAVPEPGSAAVLALLAAPLFLRRKR